jgi:2-dehydropantoate 2-reductase
MAELIAEHAPSGAMVVSLQNGVGNVDVLLARLGGMARVVPGMVPFNVVQTHGDGQPAIPSHHQRLIRSAPAGRHLRETLDARSLRGRRARRTWAACCGGKLLLNLNNAQCARGRAAGHPAPTAAGGCCSRPRSGRGWRC